MERLTGFLKLIRGTNLLLIGLGLSLFYFVILIPVHHNQLFTTLLPFTGLEFVLFVFSVFFLASAGSIIYDYYCFEADREFNAGRPLAKGTFSLDTAMYLHAAFAFAGIGLGFYLGYQCNNFKIGYIYVMCALLLYVYSAYLRKIPLAGNLLIAALAGFVLLLLLLFETSFLNTISFEQSPYVLAVLLLQVKVYGTFIFLLSLALAMINDISHVVSDKKYEVNTVAVQFGEKAAKFFTAFVLLLLLLGLFYMVNTFIAGNAIKESAYSLIAIVIPVAIAVVLLFMAKQPEHYNRLSILLKVIMFLGILSIPAFHLFNK